MIKAMLINWHSQLPMKPANKHRNATKSYSPNHDSCSFCTSMASPKSASLTAAPLVLLANNRFSGWNSTMQLISTQANTQATKPSYCILLISKKGNTNT